MVTLGARVKDNITGFEGIATGRAEYLYGCGVSRSSWSACTRVGR